MTKEIWKDIEGYEGLYQVSNLGRVKSLKDNHENPKDKEKKQHCGRNGYFVVSCYDKGKRKTLSVHRLVARAFIPNPENKPTVNHIDGNKQNNCVENLEWATQSENNKHAYAIGLMRTGENNPHAKLTQKQVAEIRTKYFTDKQNNSHRKLAKKYNVGETAIFRILNNQTYKKFK